MYNPRRGLLEGPSEGVPEEVREGLVLCKDTSSRSRRPLRKKADMHGGGKTPRSPPSEWRNEVRRVRTD